MFTFNQKSIQRLLVPLYLPICGAAKIRYSNIRRVLTDSQEKDVISLNAVSSLNRGDTLNIMMAAESAAEGIGIEYIEPDMELATASSLSE